MIEDADSSTFQMVRKVFDWRSDLGFYAVGMWIWPQSSDNRNQTSDVVAQAKSCCTGINLIKPMIIWTRTFWDGIETKKNFVIVPAVHSTSGMETEMASNCTRKIWTEADHAIDQRKPRRIRYWGSRRHPCATGCCCHAPGAACLIEQDKNIAIPASIALQEKA